MKNIKGVKEFYDDTVEMWTDEWYENVTMLPFLKKINGILLNNSRVLDLGCNCGYETRRMKDLGLEPVGLDFSERSIGLAQKKESRYQICM